MEYSEYCVTKFITLVVVLLSLHATDASSRECHFPAIYNFGDSNSDTGGLSAAFGQVGSPSGETFFHQPASRYCDGRLIIDFIANSVGLPYLSAFLDSVGSNFSHGANFATAGSTIRPQNTTLRQSGFSPFSLNVQWYQYNDFHRRSQTFRSQGEIFEKILPAANTFSEALYTFDIGQNDLTAGLFLNMSTDEVKAIVPDAIDQFKLVVKNIYSQGGRSFWIHNTGPVGCLPYVLDRVMITAGQIDSVGCAGPFNEVCQFYNTKLKEAVEQLQKDLPSAAFTYVDVYSVNRNVGCGGKIKVNGTEVMIGNSCQNPSVTINWDGVHYTEAANKWIFDRIVDGSYSDPPNSLKMACHRS